MECLSIYLSIYLDPIWTHKRNIYSNCSSVFVSVLLWQQLSWLGRCYPCACFPRWSITMPLLSIRLCAVITYSASRRAFCPKSFFTLSPRPSPACCGPSAPLSDTYEPNIARSHTHADMQTLPTPAGLLVSLGDKRGCWLWSSPAHLGTVCFLLWWQWYLNLLIKWVISQALKPKLSSSLKWEDMLLFFRYVIWQCYIGKKGDTGLLP